MAPMHHPHEIRFAIAMPPSTMTRMTAMGVNQARMFDCSAVAPVRNGEVWASTGVQVASAAISIPMRKAHRIFARGCDVMASPARSSSDALSQHHGGLGGYGRFTEYLADTAHPRPTVSPHEQAKRPLARPFQASIETSYPEAHSRPFPVWFSTTRRILNGGCLGRMSDDLSHTAARRSPRTAAPPALGLERPLDSLASRAPACARRTARARTIRKLNSHGLRIPRHRGRLDSQVLWRPAPLPVLDNDGVLDRRPLAADGLPQSDRHLLALTSVGVPS